MDSPVIDPDASDLTGDLLDRARAGDDDALNQLFERHLPMLRRWAHGRLPRWARDVADTTDIVQETILETLKRLDRFEHRGDGALQAYLRQAVMNRIRNELRKRAIRGVNATLDSRIQDEATSPLEAAIAQELLDQYDTALERLKPEEREAVVSRVEFDLSYAELAEVLGKQRHADREDDAGTRVVEEGRLMARVRHPNVVAIYGAQRIEGVSGLWMELVKGRTLAAELAEKGPFRSG